MAKTTDKIQPALDAEVEVVETKAPVATETPASTGISPEAMAEIAKVAASAAATAVAQTLPTGVSVKEHTEEESKRLNVMVARRDGKRQAAAQEYAKEEMVSVSISPSYRPYLGRVAHISLNGVSVYIPVDGGYYKVNKSHAGLLLGTIRKYDDQITRGERMSDVQSNLDSSPGKLQF